MDPEMEKVTGDVDNVCGDDCPNKLPGDPELSE
jgi:hypothetical protein